MTETEILQHGLQLMAQSPFQTSLTPKFTGMLNGSSSFRDISSILGDSEDFSDTSRFLRQRSTIANARDLEVHNRAVSTHTHLLSPQLQAEVSTANDGSYLKVQALAEYAISQLRSDTQLMTLNELISAQQQIDQLIEIRDQIESQLKNNSKLIMTTLQNGGAAHEDEKTGIVGTLASTNMALTEQLLKANRDIREKDQLLSSQYLLALAFTHVDNTLTSERALQLQKVQQKRNTEDRQTEELMSYVASCAVKRNIALPTPTGDSSELKAQWAKECLDALLTSGTSTPVSSETRDIKTADSSNTQEELDRVKTALQDLQFAHSYLTKQYEGERSINSTVSETLKKKRLALENKLSETVIQLEKANQHSILVEHEKNMLEQKLTDKLFELNELQKRHTQLKIDQFGLVQEPSPFASPISDKENTTPASPVTGLPVPTSAGSKFHPKTPLLQQNGNPVFRLSTSSTSPMKFNSSISVMRGEFKKMVCEMQSDYESQLEKEKVERMRLEQLVKLYEERNGDEDML